MEKLLRVKNNEELQVLIGNFDENIKLVEAELDVKIFPKHGGLKISGTQEQVDKALCVLESLQEKRRRTRLIDRQDVTTIIRATKLGKSVDINSLLDGSIDVPLKDITIVPKTKGQNEYIEAIKHYDIVFCIGPAGTGKTYLAMAMAVAALKKGIVKRIVLTRPAIEAGESLGFLPGNLTDKISPYLIPLYDALYDMMEVERIEKYRETGIIEAAPIAYMRGRTLNDAFVVLDEAQNCTSDQMKMFLTRLGFDSKTVITGDITQSDLTGGKPDGLLQAEKLFKDIQGIKFSYLTGADVVRHHLVQEIIKAYDAAEHK